MTLDETIRYTDNNNEGTLVEASILQYLTQLQDIFNEMEVMEEFEDEVWIKVSKQTLFGELK
jgi:hypothetical protein